MRFAITALAAASLLAGCTSPVEKSATLPPLANDILNSTHEGYSPEIRDGRVYLGRVVGRRAIEITPASLAFRRMQKLAAERDGYTTPDRLAVWQLIVEIPRVDAAAPLGAQRDLPPLPVVVLACEAAQYREDSWVNLMAYGSPSVGYVQLLPEEQHAYVEGFSASLPPDSDTRAVIVSSSPMTIYADALAWPRLRATSGFATRVGLFGFRQMTCVEHVVEAECPLGIRRVSVLMPDDGEFKSGQSVYVRTHGVAASGYAELVRVAPRPYDRYRPVTPTHQAKVDSPADLPTH